MGMIPQGYTVNHFLTDPDAWFIKTDAPNGMKMFQRVAIKTGFEGDFDTGNVRYKARERYSFGFSDPRGILVHQVHLNSTVIRRMESHLRVAFLLQNTFIFL
jgi:hypothetical protein